MPPSPRSAAAVAALLRDLGPQLCRGPGTASRAARLSTGIPALDGLLGGGSPAGG